VDVVWEARIEWRFGGLDPRAGGAMEGSLQPVAGGGKLEPSTVASIERGCQG